MVAGPANSAPPADHRRHRAIAHRISGIFFVVTALAGLVLGTFVLARLAEYGADPRNAGAVDPTRLPRIVRAIVDNRLYFILAGLPALAGGILLLVGARPRRLWYFIALVGVLILFGVLLVCFIAWIAPLYEYQEL